MYVDVCEADRNQITIENVQSAASQGENTMAEHTERAEHTDMGDLEQKIRLGIGSAAAAAAIFAPLNYTGKSFLTALAATTLLSAIFRKAPITQMLGI